MCNNTQKKKAAGAGKDFTLFFGVMLHFNFKCATTVYIFYSKEGTKHQEILECAVFPSWRLLITFFSLIKENSATYLRICLSFTKINRLVFVSIGL